MERKLLSSHFSPTNDWKVQSSYFLFDSYYSLKWNVIFNPFRTTTIERKSIPSTILSEYKKDPQPLELQKLISNCNNLQTAFQLYNILINNNQKPTLGIFKSLITICLDLKQPEKVKYVWEDIEKYSINIDHYCFGLLLRACGKIGDNILAKKLFSNVKNNRFNFRMNVID